MDLRELAPSPVQRMMIVGTTGSGKSVLERHLLKLYSRSIVIDPKLTLGSGERGGGHLPGYELARTPRELERMAGRHPHTQYRPEMRYQNPGDFERVFDWIYRRGSTMLAVDEVFDVHHHNRAPISLRRILTSGRELGIGFIGCTQRPRGIDRRLMTEAEIWAVFHLRDEDDRRFLRPRIGMGRLPSYGFWWSKDVEPFAEPVVKRLKL
jgi:DNA helicase HerA-like ATPase